MNNGKVMLGIMAGLASGALLGVLFAPDRGKDTRRRLGRKGDNYVKELGDKIDNLIDDVSKKYEHAKDEASAANSMRKSKA